MLATQQVAMLLAQVVIHVAKKNCYAATVNGRLTVKLGGRAWTPAAVFAQQEQWCVAMRGYNFTVWLRSDIRVPEDVHARLQRTRSSRSSF